MQAYQDMVFSTAARLLGNSAQAEDIAQEVFLKSYQHFAELRSNAQAGGWLKTVTTNLSLNHLSRYRRRWRLFSELRPDSPDRESSDSDAPELDWPLPETLLTELHTQQQRQVLETALQRLPEQQRVPLVLYHFQEMSYDEIAQRLQISLAKVKIDILRGRAALAGQLSLQALSAIEA